MQMRFSNSLASKVNLDIEYRKNTKQQRNRLDFIYPKTKVYERAPLFIYIHGGGNTGGTKNALYNKSSLILKELTESGIAVATIDYRVFGAGEELGFHQLFEDCKDALRFLAKILTDMGSTRISSSHGGLLPGFQSTGYGINGK